MNKIYLSASTQENNKGVDNYGTEEDNMFKLRDLTIKYIKSGNHADDFTIYKNSNKNMSLSDIVADSNNRKPKIHMAFHSNAGNSKARGCEVYYSMYNTNGKGKKLANIWYIAISAVTPTVDRGVHSDSILYNNGLYELRETGAVSSLSEFIFHTNKDDVKFFKENIDKFAIATAQTIYKYFGYDYVSKENESKSQYYHQVVAGSFLDEKNAKKRQDILKKYKIESFINKIKRF